MHRTRSRATGRAVVRVRACALNHLDLWERRGIRRVALPLPHIPGSDVSGEVIDGRQRSDGSGHPRAAPARSTVRRMPGVPGGSRQSVRDLRRPRAEVGRRLRRARRGARREPDSDSGPRRLRYEAAAFPPDLPDRLAHAADTRVAAAGRDACSCLPAAAGWDRPRSGRTPSRCPCAATAGSEDRSHAGDSAPTTCSITIRAIFPRTFAGTDGRGVDVVVEHVGEATWGRSVRCLRYRRATRHVRRDDRRGDAGHRPAAPVRPPAVAARVIYGRFAELQELPQLLFDGTFRPVVDSRLPLWQRPPRRTDRLESRPSSGSRSRRLTRRRVRPEPSQPSTVQVTDTPVCTGFRNELRPS